MTSPGVDRTPRDGDLAVVGHVPDLGVDAGRIHDLADDLLRVLALLAAGTEDFDDAHGVSPSGVQGVEQVADEQDPDGDDAGEDRDELRLHDPPEDDHLRERQGGDGHHEREGRAHRQALGDEHLDDRDGPGGVAVERDAEQDEGRHGERVVAAADRHDEVGRDEAVDDGADADADEDERQDLPDEAARGRPGVADPVLERQLHLDGPGATRLDLPDVRLHVALQVEPADDQAGHDRDDETGRDVHQRDGRARTGPTAARSRSR